MWNPKKDNPATQPPAATPASPEAEGSCCGHHGGDCGGPDETAALIEELQKQISDLAKARDEAQGAYTRTLADYSNSQRRALSNEQQAREQGVRGVLMSIMPVVDHFELALSQDPERASAKDVIDGVAMIKDELLRALAAQGIGLIRPGKGEPFDPTRHEAVLQQQVEGVAPGHVVMTLRIGYTLNDRIVRPAQVAVAPKGD